MMSFFESATYWSVPAWHTINLIDGLWTAIGALSAGIILSSLPAVYKDWRASIGVLRHIAQGYLRRELVRFVQAASVFAVGVYACIQPPPLGKDIITPIGIFITAALFIIGIGIGLQSLLDRRLRHQLIDYLELQEAFKEQSLRVEGKIAGDGLEGELKLDIAPKDPH